MSFSFSLFSLASLLEVQAAKDTPREEKTLERETKKREEEAKLKRMKNLSSTNWIAKSLKSIKSWRLYVNKQFQFVLLCLLA